MKKNAALLLLCLVAVSAQGGEMFRWVDADGKVHYTDQPPPSDAKNVEEKNLGGSVIGTSEASYATRQAAKDFPVTLYITDNCGKACDSARELLSQRGVPYTAKNPQTSAADNEALIKLVGDAFVPSLVIGSSATKGFNKGIWDKELDSAGYPKTVPKKPAADKGKPATESNGPRHPWAGGR